MTTQLLRREPFHLTDRSARTLPRRAASGWLAELVGAAALVAIGVIGIAVRAIAHLPG